MILSKAAFENQQNYSPSLFPKQQIIDFSKFKELADDSFELDENGRKFSKWIENTVGKGEIALENSKYLKVKVRIVLKMSTFSMQMVHVCSTSLLKTLGKGEIARNEQFLLFPVSSKDLYCRHVPFAWKKYSFSAQFLLSPSNTLNFQ